MKRTIHQAVKPKDAIVSIRFHRNEFEWISNQAAVQNMTISAFIREAALAYGKSTGSRAQITSVSDGRNVWIPIVQGETT